MHTTCTLIHIYSNISTDLHGLLSPKDMPRHTSTHTNISRQVRRRLVPVPANKPLLTVNKHTRPTEDDRDTYERGFWRDKPKTIERIEQKSLLNTRSIEMDTNLR